MKHAPDPHYRHRFPAGVGRFGGRFLADVAPPSREGDVATGGTQVLPDDSTDAGGTPADHGPNQDGG